MKCNILSINAEPAKIKEISYLQVQNTESKMRQWFFWCGTSKRKRKWTICRRGTLKAKGDGGFAGEEQARAKENGLSASAEH